MRGEVKCSQPNPPSNLIKQNFGGEERCLSQPENLTVSLLALLYLSLSHTHTFFLCKSKTS